MLVYASGVSVFVNLFIYVLVARIFMLCVHSRVCVCDCLCGCVYMYIYVCVCCFCAKVAVPVVRSRVGTIVRKVRTD